MSGAQGSRPILPRRGSGAPAARRPGLLALLLGLAALMTALAPAAVHAAGPTEPSGRADQAETSRTEPSQTEPSQTARTGHADRSAPAGVHLHVELTPRAVTVGDRITAVLTLTVPAEEAARLARPGGEPRFPTWGDRWGEAEVLEVGSVEHRTGAGASTWRQRLVLAVFQPGSVTLPRATVRVPLLGDGIPDGDGDRTAEVTSDAPPALEVRSVLPQGADAATLQPTTAAPPRPLPAGAPFWWTLAGGAVLAGAFVLLGSARRRRRGSTAAAPLRPPFEELTACLDELHQLDGDAPGARGPEHVTLSLALRRYLGRRLDFPAIESTTTEVRRRLRDRRLPDPVIEPAALVLERCDAVKFAQARVAPGAFTASLAATRELARTLENHLAPVTLTPVDSGTGGPHGDGRSGVAA